MSQVKSNEGLSEEIMLLSEELSLMKALPLFPFWSFSPPWGNYSSKFSCIKKKKKGINRGCLCNFPGPSENCQSNLQRWALQGQGRRDKQAWVSFKMPVYSWPHPCHPPPPQKRERAASKVPYQRMFPQEPQRCWGSCWVISAANKWCQAWHFLAGRNRTPLR